MKKKKVFGNSDRPRLFVFRSLNHIYAQLVDDDKGITLCGAGSLEPEIKKSGSKLKKTEEAKLVGQSIAKKALGKGIQNVIFDRGNKLYHGRIAALADGARSAGLKF